MRALHVIFLAICFYLIYSVLADSQSDETSPADNVPSGSSYYAKKEFLLFEDERFKPFNMSFFWHYFLIHEIGSHDNEEMYTEYQYPDIEPRANKGANMFRKKRSITTIINYLDTFMDLNSTIFQNLYDFVMEIIYQWVMTWKPHNNVCNFALNTEEKDYPILLELINSLPSCPCKYPTRVHKFVRVFDENSKEERWWTDIEPTGFKTRPNSSPDFLKGTIYRSKSTLAKNGSMAGQFCCYDENYGLLTQGPNAGNTFYMPGNIGDQMNKVFDLLPLDDCNLCRLIKKLTPNNGNKCPKNPEY